jgi:hypothetical protein
MIQTPDISKEFVRLYPEDGMISEASKRRESLSPNRHSGVPDRYARIMICPDTSARRAVPIC